MRPRITISDELRGKLQVVRVRKHHPVTTQQPLMSGGRSLSVKLKGSSQPRKSARASHDDT